MSEFPTTPLAVAVAIILALVGVVWGLFRKENDGQGKRLDKLEAKVAAAEESIARLFERMKAREDAHAQHREDMADRLQSIDTKLDRLIEKLIAPRSHSPQPGRYGLKPEDK